MRGPASQAVGSFLGCLAVVSSRRPAAAADAGSVGLHSALENAVQVATLTRDCGREHNGPGLAWARICRPGDLSVA